MNHRFEGFGSLETIRSHSFFVAIVTPIPTMAGRTTALPKTVTAAAVENPKVPATPIPTASLTVSIVAVLHGFFFRKTWIRLDPPYITTPNATMDTAAATGLKTVNGYA